MCQSLKLSATEDVIVASGRVLKGLAPFGAYIKFDTLQGVETCFAKSENVSPEGNWAGLRIVGTYDREVLGFVEKGKRHVMAGKARLLEVQDALGRKRTVLVTREAKGQRIPMIDVPVVHSAAKIRKRRKAK